MRVPATMRVMSLLTYLHYRGPLTALATMKSTGTKQYIPGTSYCRRTSNKDTTLAAYAPQPAATSTPRGSLDGVSAGPLPESYCISSRGRHYFFPMAMRGSCLFALLPHSMRISTTALRCDLRGRWRPQEYVVKYSRVGVSAAFTYDLELE